MATTPIRWGIIGPGTIAENFAVGLSQIGTGRLHAIASRSADRRAAFGDRHGVAVGKRFETYAELVADPEVDAVYVATPHPWHAELGLLALRAGKPVLVEKPAGLNEAEVTVLVEASRQEGVFFMEAYMYRCHPQIARLIEVIGSGRIGRVEHIRASFGFDARANPQSRVHAYHLAGGGIIDVGGYPLTGAGLVAGAAIGQRFAAPESLRATGRLGATGVDEISHASAVFPGDITAELACAICRVMENTFRVDGSEGSLLLTNPWVPGRNEGPSDTTIRITTAAGEEEEVIRHPWQLFAFEADVASRAIAEGLTEPPAPCVSHAESIATAAVLDLWRREVGYRTFAESPGVVRRLAGSLPKGLPEVPRRAIDGVDLPLSQFVIGCDNRNTPAEGAVIWDAWMEAGGNAFDTAFVYGGGQHEEVLGQWIASRKVADEIVVVVKGGVTPYCTPDAIEAQLDISLARLGLDRAPIYILHRDNPDVPVDEFVDLFDRLRNSGRVGIWGGSNWSTGRFAAAREAGRRSGKPGPRILNNNLSLAVMERPVWFGCISSNDPASLAFLAENDIVHLSWSSQARGYFLPEPLRHRLPVETAPESCFGSARNEERRRRAETLARARGVEANHVAASWVLYQPFPSFALIGPRSPGELASTLPALTLGLSPEERAWLNLETDSAPAALVA
ncbi:aldo/keto reductase [Histidinibacterium lentulum]|uniref:Oxidoreductase n=1 Tax=Histidinibacterium lentulum TaxID=2480588 RepID=A0A3N2QYE4_9RHOB|nr:aldo/keto reductase [Histidinibacterium lentulum]ROU00163.1 oxidoreductase [Histidinibacterium lentulum]